MGRGGLLLIAFLPITGRISPGGALTQSNSFKITVRKQDTVRSFFWRCELPFFPFFQPVSIGVAPAFRRFMFPSVHLLSSTSESQRATPLIALISSSISVRPYLLGSSPLFSSSFLSLLIASRLASLYLLSLLIKLSSSSLGHIFFMDSSSFRAPMRFIISDKSLFPRRIPPLCCYHRLS